MSNIEQNTIDKLFRDLIRVYSTSATSMIGLNSIQTAIEELVCENSDFYGEITLEEIKEFFTEYFSKIKRCGITFNTRICCQN